MQRIPVEIRPGGMLADVVSNKLGTHQHVEVKNLKQVKQEEWHVIAGYINSYNNTSPTSITAIRSGLEVNDDLSGDRFFIYHQGTAIKRIDYDSGNSPLTGYENETPETLTLPDGVTVTADDTVRFFVHNGVVRITGGTVPMWYGYIRRKLMYTGYEEVDDLDFETASHVNNFTAANATRAQSSTIAKFGTYSMLITTVGTEGYVYRTITAKTGGKYIVWCHGNKNDASPNTDDWYIKVGTSHGAGDILVTQHQAANTVSWRSCFFEFEVPNDWDNETTTIYISIFPETDDTGSGDTLYIDEWRVAESYAQLILDDWHLGKAELAAPQQTDINILEAYQTDETDTGNNVYCKAGFIYDQAQYSLMTIPTVTISVPNAPIHRLFADNSYNGMRLKVRLQGDELLKSFLNNRLTGMNIIFGT